MRLVFTLAAAAAWSLLSVTAEPSIESAFDNLSLDNADDNIEILECLLERLPENYQNVAALSLHRNGDGEPCATLQSSTILPTMASIIDDYFDRSCDLLDSSPYEMEAFLTLYFAELIEKNYSDDTTTCSIDKSPVHKSSNSKNIEPIYPGFYGHCDRGSDYTVIQLDHRQLIRVGPHESLPCRFYTREGLRISSLSQFLEMLTSKTQQSSPTCSATDNNDNTCIDDTETSLLHLYAAPAGRVFMFAPRFVGERFELPHITGAQGEPIALEVLSLSPRVFDIYNFFSPIEAQALIDKAVSETSETHKMHRSTTGTTGASIFDRRTSENAWDTHGALAQKIKRRCFTVLGLDKYYESYSDGLQILRYNLTTAYVPHHDYLDDNAGTEAYDYDPGGKGGNRFATILLYMTDLPETGGGQTVFSRAYAHDDTERLTDGLALKKWRERHNDDANVLQPGSWEEKMAAQCESRLSVRPHASRAVLFYSQHPNGVLDPMSIHGGCPVLNGTKWAANLWVWNAPRPEYQGAPLKKVMDDISQLLPNVEDDDDDDEDATYYKVLATFKNTKYKNAAINFGDEYFTELPFGESISLNTYETHEWHVVDRDSGQIVKSVLIGRDKKVVEIEL